MNRFLLFTALLFNLFLVSVATAHPLRSKVGVLVEGGGPRIALNGRSSGALTVAECKALTGIDLLGCVAEPRVSELRLYTTDAAGRVSVLRGTGSTFTPEMKNRLAALPIGSSFRLEVTAFDGKLKLDVPTASFQVVTRSTLK